VAALLERLGLDSTEVDWPTGPGPRKQAWISLEGVTFTGEYDMAEPLRIDIVSDVV
jgi:hypothetical protein